MASHASEETGRLVPAVPFPTRRGMPSSCEKSFGAEAPWSRNDLGC